MLEKITLEAKASHTGIGQAETAARAADTFHARAPDLLEASVWGAIADTLGLSTREAQIVRLACYDESVGTMAGKLRLSEHTIHTYRERLFRKLGVKSLCQVVSVAFGTYVALQKAAASPANGRDDSVDRVSPQQASASEAACAD